MTTAAHTRTALQTQLMAIERQMKDAMATEKRILDAAQDRLKKVQAQLKTVQPRTLLEESAADQYQELILERGQLQHTIALAEYRLQNTGV